MYIIDKNKDYYDYISSIYGVDKKVTYDRRGSVIISNVNIIAVSGCSLNSNFNGVEKDYFKKEPEYHIILEIGYIQYLIRLFNFILEKNINFTYYDVIDCSMEILRIFKDNKHYYKYPVSIRGVNLKSHWKNWKIGRVYKYAVNDSFEESFQVNEQEPIDNPILSNTSVTSLVTAEEVWKDLQTYISSLNNDQIVNIPMTDVERAETHGFDKKTSFRNPIK